MNLTNAIFVVKLYMELNLARVLANLVHLLVSAHIGS